MNKEETQLQAAISASIGYNWLPEESFILFKEKLSAYINELINQDFEKLVTILYRVDVSEKKLKQLLSDNPSLDSGSLITECIIERQLQKIKAKKQFQQNNDAIPDEEKW